MRFLKNTVGNVGLIVKFIFLIIKKRHAMGLTYATIQLQNGDDVSDYNRKRIGEDEIRQVEISALVDTGSVMMVINESIRAALDLPIIGKRPSQLADGTRLELPVVGSIMIKYLDRWCITSALLLPDDEEPLLGAIPMEEMDLYIHPARNELLVVHPEGPVMSLK
jgi:clan AA aspartic protease